MLPNRARRATADQLTPEKAVHDIHLADRSIYATHASSRIVGLAGICTVFAAVVASLFLSIEHFAAAEAPPALSIVNLMPPASPPEAPPEQKVAPKPVEKQEPQPEWPEVQPIKSPLAPIAPVPLPPAASKPALPKAAAPETAAPKTAPAPPAPQVSSHAPNSWEGRVLAALNKHRRYPRLAMVRRQQGVPYIRFVMNREGKILSSRLERSSGFADLDREAAALPKRAQPLPKPPDDVPGDPIELVVPVEFFLR